MAQLKEGASRLITWQQTRRRLSEDRARLRDFLDRYPSGRPVFLWTCPSYQAVLLYRLAHYFFVNGWRWTGRFFWHLNLLLTGSDINPSSDIEGGFVLISPLCVTILGKVGKNSTWEIQSGIGGGRGTRDIGAGPGLPVVGENVILGAGCMVVGPIHIGDRCYVGPRSIALEDMPPDSELVGPASTTRPVNLEYARAVGTAREDA